jgi:glycerol-3-phosphate dehydrogenase
LAEQAVNRLVTRLGKPARACATGTTKLPGAPEGAFGAALDRTPPAEQHIARLYGTRAPQMLALATGNPELRQQLSESGDIAAEVPFSVRDEMAFTLDDVVMRRTGIGQLGSPERQVLQTCAQLMAREFGWNEQRINTEIALVEQNFRTVAA